MVFFSVLCSLVRGEYLYRPNGFLANYKHDVPTVGIDDPFIDEDFQGEIDLPDDFYSSLNPDMQAARIL